MDLYHQRYFPYKLMRMSLQNLYEYRILVTTVQAFLVAFVMVLSILEPILNYNGPESIADSMEMFVPLYQWMFKIIFVKLNRNNLYKAHKMFEKFWPANKFGNRREQKIVRFLNNMNAIPKVLYCLFVGVVVLMTVKPLMLLHKKRTLPVALYNVVDLTQSPYYEFFFILFQVVTNLIVCFVTGLDGIFLLLITHGICQVQLLKYGFRNLKAHDEEDAEREMIKECVDHHAHLIEYVKLLKSMFSSLLMNQFLSSVFEVCMSIYLASTKGIADVVFLVRCGLFALSAVFQTFLYCITGAIITDEMSSVPDSLFHSEWWNMNTLSLKRGTVFMLQMSQQSYLLKAAGIATLDLENFVTILRLSFSFYTLMQSRNSVTEQ